LITSSKMENNASQRTHLRASDIIVQIAGVSNLCDTTWSN